MVLGELGYRTHGTLRTVALAVPVHSTAVHRSVEASRRVAAAARELLELADWSPVATEWHCAVLLEAAAVGPFAEP